MEKKIPWSEFVKMRRMPEKARSKHRKREVERRSLPSFSGAVVVPTGFSLEKPTAPPADESEDSGLSFRESDIQETESETEQSEEVQQNKINFYLEFIRGIRGLLGNSEVASGSSPSENEPLELINSVVNSRENNDVAQELIVKIERVLRSDKSYDSSDNSNSSPNLKCDPTGETSASDQNLMKFRVTTFADVAALSYGLSNVRTSVVAPFKKELTKSIFLNSGEGASTSGPTRVARKREYIAPSRLRINGQSSSDPHLFPPPLPARPPPVTRNALNSTSSATNPTTPRLCPEVLQDLKAAVGKKRQVDAKLPTRWSSPHPLSCWTESASAIKDEKAPPLPKSKPGVHPKPPLTTPCPAPQHVPRVPFAPPRVKKRFVKLTGIKNNMGNSSLSVKVAASEENLPDSKLTARLPQKFPDNKGEATESSPDPAVDNLSSCAWYHPVSWTTALRKLWEMGQDGAFLVRPSSRVAEGIPFAISFSSDGQIFNCHVKVSIDGKYFLGNSQEIGQVFETLSELIRFHQTTPALLKVEGNPQPISVLFLMTPEKDEIAL